MDYLQVKERSVLRRVLGVAFVIVSIPFLFTAALILANGIHFLATLAGFLGLFLLFLGFGFFYVGRS